MIALFNVVSVNEFAVTLDKSGQTDVIFLGFCTLKEIDFQVKDQGQASKMTYHHQETSPRRSRGIARNRCSRSGVPQYARFGHELSPTLFC